MAGNHVEDHLSLPAASSLADGSTRFPPSTPSAVDAPKHPRLPVARRPRSAPNPKLPFFFLSKTKGYEKTKKLLDHPRTVSVLHFPANCGTLRAHKEQHHAESLTPMHRINPRFAAGIVGNVTASRRTAARGNGRGLEDLQQRPVRLSHPAAGPAGGVSRLPADVSLAGRLAVGAEQHDSRRLLRPQRHPAGRRQAAGGHLPAYPRRQRAADRFGLLGAGETRHSGHFVQAALLRQPRHGQGAAKRLAENPKLFAGAIVQAGEDIRRTIDLLASRPEVNPERIGIVGISLGGIIAATAAGAEPRIHRAGLILAGGDLLPIIHHARETRDLSEMIQKLPPAERAEVEASIAAADPLKFAAALRRRARMAAC